MDAPGRKDDQGKLDWSLVHPRLLSDLLAHLDADREVAYKGPNSVYSALSFLALGQCTRHTIVTLAGFLDALREHMCLSHIDLLGAAVRVLEYGAARYGRMNWARVENWRQRYYSAAVRHCLSPWRDADAESGLQHAAHVLTNVIFLTTKDTYETNPY
jgi:Domain of unknown function (DUF5664)